MRRKCIETSFYIQCCTCCHPWSTGVKLPKAVTSSPVSKKSIGAEVLQKSTYAAKVHHPLHHEYSCAFMKNRGFKMVIQPFTILSLLIPSSSSPAPIPSPVTYILIAVITSVQLYGSNFSRLIYTVLLDLGLKIFPYCKENPQAKRNNCFPDKFMQQHISIFQGCHQSTESCFDRSTIIFQCPSMHCERGVLKEKTT